MLVALHDGIAAHEAPLSVAAIGLYAQFETVVIDFAREHLFVGMMEFGMIVGVDHADELLHGDTLGGE